MEVGYLPIFLENKNNGRAHCEWVLDENFRTRILPLAYTSDLGILRLLVSDLDGATDALMAKGFVVRKSSGAVEVVPDRRSGLVDMLKVLAEHGIDVELTGIIPGIYQG
jgi:hypothetical protein